MSRRKEQHRESRPKSNVTSPPPPTPESIDASTNTRSPLFRIFHTSEPVTIKEQGISIRERFTEDEKKVLRDDGVCIYLLNGKSIHRLQDEDRNIGKNLLVEYPIWHPMTEWSAGLNPSHKGEVAIYPQPDRLLIPDTYNASKQKQEKLLAQDAQALRKRLGLDTITEIIPGEASTLVNILYEHYKTTGNDLLSKKNITTALNNNSIRRIYIRTENRIPLLDDSRSDLICMVGKEYDMPDDNDSSHSWFISLNVEMDHHNSSMNTCIMRCIVPIE